MVVLCMEEGAAFGLTVGKENAREQRAGAAGCLGLRLDDPLRGTADLRLSDQLRLAGALVRAAHGVRGRAGAEAVPVTAPARPRFLIAAARRRGRRAGRVLPTG